jgi:long-chain fatty acid transport protein
MFMVALVLGVAAISLFWPALAHGQGFGIYEHSACTMARGAAGVAEPCPDGSAIQVNPAGMVGAEGWTLGSGGMLVFPSSRFISDAGTRASLDSTAQLVPYGYLVYGLSPRLAVGVGAYVPYGLGVKWPLDFTGRFVSYDSRLTTFYTQPSVAAAVTDRISLGAGLTIAISSVDLRRREDLALVPFGATGLTFGALVENGTDFADTALSASGASGVGVKFGGLIKVTDAVRVGASYMSGIDVDYDGSATFTPISGNFRVTKVNPLGLPVGTSLDPLVQQVLAALPNQSASTALKMPAQFILGASVHATPRMTVVADYQWVDWSVFDTVTLDFESPSTPDERLIQNYRDTSALRFGGEYELRPALRLRVGYAYTQAAAPDTTVTPLLPEARRNHFTTGIGWKPRSNMTLDVAYQFVAHQDRRGRTVNPRPGEPPSVALNSGVYQSRGDLFGITVTLRP